MAATQATRLTVHDDPDEITISDEDVHPAFRVYTPDEVMDFLEAGNCLPSTREPTPVWQAFLARMLSTPPTPEIEAAMRFAKRELLWRRQGSA
jgi:hypothetical protein